MGTLIETEKEQEVLNDTLKDIARSYIFEVRNGWEEVIFSAEKPTIEMLEEEMGRYKRHFKNKGKA